MVLNSFIFALMAYGVAIVIAACVAFMIKFIALIVQRGEKSAATGSSEEKS